MLSTDLLPRPTPAPAPSVQSRTKIRTFVRLSTSTPALPVCVSGSSSQCRSRAGLGANELPKSAATSALHRGAHTCTAAVLPHRAVTGTEAFVQSPACTGRGRCVWVRAGGGDWGDGEGQGGGEGGGEMFHGFELKLKDSSWLREGPGASKSKGAGSPSKAGGGGSRKANAKKSNAAQPSGPPGWVMVRMTRAGRGGKSVTVLSGLPPDPSQLQTVLKKLKAQLGTGGAVKDGTVEIQGDHASKIVDALTKMGFKARGA